MLISHRINAARAALLLGAGLSFATPIWAQNAAFDAAANNVATAPLQRALSAEKTPLTLKVSDLDASWRRFKPSKSLGADFQVRPTNSEDSTNYESYSYITRGETLQVGEETFLLAYRTPYFNYQELDPSMPVTPAETEALNLLRSIPPEANPSTLDRYIRFLSVQTLNLCLLNVRTIGDLGDIRAFDAKTDVIKITTAADKAQSFDQAIAERANLHGDAINQRVDSDLKQIGLAMSMYIQDYDEKLPPMRSLQKMADIKNEFNTGWSNAQPATVQQVLAPYMKSAEIFAHPTTREIYRPNINVSGRSLEKLYVSPGQIITFYEASPTPDGTRAVLYLDGHVRRERETDWARIRAASDAIAPPFGVGKRALNAKPTSGTVTLYQSAALAYMWRRQRDERGRSLKIYLSKSKETLYSRDSQTNAEFYLGAPDDGITIPAEQAQEFREFQGYNGQPFGRTFGDDVSAAVLTPKIKTALGANAALSGSQINVDTMLDGNVVALRGTTTSNAQKTLAEAIAKKNAPGFRIDNQLVVNSN